jgi:hypothetical protein
MASLDNENCEGCYYCKPRDVDPDTKNLEFGPFCLESGQPVKCAIAGPTCEKVWAETQAQDESDNYEQLALKYATSNQRKR